MPEVFAVFMMLTTFSDCVIMTFRAGICETWGLVRGCTGCCGLIGIGDGVQVSGMIMLIRKIREPRIKSSLWGMLSPDLNMLSLSCLLIHRTDVLRERLGFGKL